MDLNGLDESHLYNTPSSNWQKSKRQSGSTDATASTSGATSKGEKGAEWHQDVVGEMRYPDMWIYVYIQFYILSNIYIYNTNVYIYIIIYPWIITYSTQSWKTCITVKWDSFIVNVLQAGSICELQTTLASPGPWFRCDSIGLCWMTLW